MEAVRDGSVQNVDLSIWIPYLTPSGPPSPVFPSKNTGKTKRQLHDRKTEHCKALAENDKTSAIADHVETTRITDILAKGKTDYHCKIKETLFIWELEPAFNVNVGMWKADALLVYSSFYSWLLSICLI